METIEQLVVCEQADVQRRVGKTFVYGFINGYKRDVVTSVFENRPNAGGLFFDIA